MQNIDSHSIEKYWTPIRQKEFLAGKKLALLPWQHPKVLVAMDLMNPTGSLTRSQTKKLFQVNHMLGLLRPTLERLAKEHACIRIAEAAAGNAYVSLLLAWYFTEVAPHPVKIIVSDNNPKLVKQSQDRFAMLGWDGIAQARVASILEFQWAGLLQDCFPEELADEEKKMRPHLFVALHACDILSCHAIAQALRWKSDALAIAPCCQAELAQTWKETGKSQHPLRGIWESPQLRRAVAADYTDAQRLLIIKALGYDAQAMEFVPSEHTPKNRLILGHRKQQYDVENFKSFQDLKGASGNAVIELERLLQAELGGVAQRI